MATIAQVQTAVANFESQIDAFCLTAIDGYKPDRARATQIYNIVQATKAQMHQIISDAIAKAQALGAQ